MCIHKCTSSREESKLNVLLSWNNKSEKRRFLILRRIVFVSTVKVHVVKKFIGGVKAWVQQSVVATNDGL